MTCIDAQAIAKEHPTFDAPTPEALAAIIPDDYVKVCIDGAERLWCQVASIHGSTIMATVCNSPVVVDLELNDPISFEMRHVYDIISDGEKS